MKLLFEIYRILRELGIKTKDIIGVGTKIKQVGKTLANADVNTKVLQLVHRTGEISESLQNELLNIGRSLRNLNDIEKRKFLTNIKRIKDVFSPAEAEVIDIATRAKLPASGIEKLKSNVGFPRNVHPESDVGRIMTHARKSKPLDTTKNAMQAGEARWILNKAIKDDLFAFKPEEIKMIKGGKGDIIELFRNYYGSNAVRNLPAEGSINSASKFADELKWAVDENGLLANHVDFNKEAINWKLTRELVKDYSKKVDDHPFTTFTELKAELPLPELKVEGPFPTLSPENDAFIILDDVGTTIGRYEGRVSADEVTGKSVTKWYDRWDAKNKKLLTDSSKYKFSGAVDETGKEIIKSEGVIEGGKINVSEHIKFIKSKEPIEAMKEANAIIGRKNPSYKGRYKNITDDEAKQILKDVDDHISGRNLPPEFASGGRIGYGEGTILPEPKPEEVYLDEKLKKLLAAKKTILANADAFDDKGEALIQTINNDIAKLRKRYFDIEEIPGHATGGVSNLFRRR